MTNRSGDEIPASDGHGVGVASKAAQGIKLGRTEKNLDVARRHRLIARQVYTGRRHIPGPPPGRSRLGQPDLATGVSEAVGARGRWSLGRVVRSDRWRA